VPADTQRLICCGKQLSDEQQLGNTCRDGNTIHMTASLRGGKGGFGALLRNAGRARNTDNFDACRTLDGRRMREVEAEKKRAEWLADAQSRALEKVALQHLKDQAREARRAEAEQVDTRGVLHAQQQTLQATQAAVADALAAGGRKRLCVCVVNWGGQFGSVYLEAVGMLGGIICNVTPFFCVSLGC
jgi:hypothetical protein